MIARYHEIQEKLKGKESLPYAETKALFAELKTVKAALKAEHGVEKLNQIKGIHPGRPKTHETITIKVPLGTIEAVMTTGIDTDGTIHSPEIAKALYAAFREADTEPIVEKTEAPE